MQANVETVRSAEEVERLITASEAGLELKSVKLYSLNR